MKRIRALVSKVRLTAKRNIRRAGRQGLSVLCITALLLSLAGGFVLVPEKEVKAMAGADDVAILGEFLQLVLTLASTTAGADQSDVLTSADAAGITSFTDARGYIHSSFSGDSNFLKIFRFDPVKMQLLEGELAARFLMDGYLVSRDFLQRLWAQYDPREEPWDPDKWGELSEDEKVNILFDLDTFVEDIRKVAEAGTAPPDPDYNDEDENNDENDPDGEKRKKHYKKGGQLIDEDGNMIVLETDAVQAAFNTATFQAVYYLTKKLNYTAQKAKFEPKEDADVCDYSYEYWSRHASSPTSDYYIYSSFLTAGLDHGAITGGDTELEKIFGDGMIDDTLHVGFSNGLFVDGRATSSLAGHKLYPLTYTVDGSSHFKVALDEPQDKFLTENSSFRNSIAYNGFLSSWLWSYKSTSPYEKSIPFGSACRGVKVNDLGVSIGQFDDYDSVSRSIQNRHLRSPGDRHSVLCPDLIDCGTLANANKLTALLHTGQYKVDDLLGYMEDGWKGLPDKSWQAVVDKGKTAKKALDTEKGGKYKHTGTKYTKDGKKKQEEGVSFSSLVDGMLSNDTTTQNVPKTGMDDILGDQVTITDPVSFPKPEDYPDGVFQIPNAPVSPDDPDDPGATPTPTPVPGGLTPSIPGTDSDIQWYERFPFCIPWDLYNGVSALNAKTKVPKFDIPFEVKSLGIKETISIDFSEYENFALICRWFFRISFAVGLALISRNIIKG